MNGIFLCVITLTTSIIIIQWFIISSYHQEWEDLKDRFDTEKQDQRMINRRVQEEYAIHKKLKKDISDLLNKSK